MDTVSVSVPGVGEVRVKLAEGGGPVTPASRVTAEAIGLSSSLLRGVGLDWGAGTGLLAIASALLPAVEMVVAIEHDESAVAVSRENVERNGLSDKVKVVQADLFEPVRAEDRMLLDSIIGEVDFLVTNPPASETGDGLDWRREVLGGAVQFLRAGAPSIVQISAQYGQARIGRIAEDVGGYRYVGPVATSEWVPFDLGRADLREALATFAREERAGGPPYRFRLASGSPASATDVIDTDLEPLTRWQVHRFDRLAE
jgi:hypothetical protein